MPLYEMTGEGIVAIEETAFTAEGIKEREDLQRLLRERIAVVAPDIMVIAEEFGEWEDSKRRIDLLALDKDANLVVVELKRTEDGGHMELQAIRYAAMVSTMTFEQAVEAHQNFLGKMGRDEKAEEAILTFLGWDEAKEDVFGQDVRIVLVSAEFSKEVTTAAMWLNQRGLDIRCTRLKPYNLDGRLLVDVQQLIPLPEAAEYQVRVREKEQRKRSSRWQQKDLPTIWKELEANRSEREIRAAREIHDWLKDLGTEIFPTANGFAQLQDGNNHRHYFFKVMTNGQIEVWFQYLSRKPPFSDESMRSELLRRLNSIPGVDIQEDKLSGKPKFPISVLTDKGAMDLFKQTFEWAITEITNHPES